MMIIMNNEHDDNNNNEETDHDHDVDEENKKIHLMTKVVKIVRNLNYLIVCS